MFLKVCYNIVIYDELNSGCILDITIAATIGCGNNSEIGVVGLDLHFLNFIEDVTYYSNYQHYTYAFIIDNNGITIMHPSYPRPNVISKQPLFVDIQYLEKVPNIETLRHLLLTEEKGNYTIHVQTHNVLSYKLNLIFVELINPIFRCTTFGGEF